MLGRYVQGRSTGEKYPTDEEYDPTKYAGWKQIRASEVKGK